jgi:signal peptidase I
MTPVQQVEPKSAKYASPWLIAALVALGLTALVLLSASPFLFRALLFQPFNIPARSMIPTFMVGDYLFVSKYAYGYSRYTWPFSSTPFSGRIWGAEPARGDVVVFLLPKDNSTVYVKRIAGVPGDRIQMKDGLLYINDVPVKRERLADFVGEDPCGSDAAKVKRWRETLPSGVSYETLDCVDNGFYDNTPIYTVPAGHFFMLGDNRDNSTDSRMLSAIGYVPLENIIGRASMIFFSIDTADNASKVRTERIGQMVH